MANIERFQNPIVDSTVNLRLFSFNSNNRTNLYSVSRVDIYFLDPTERREDNPDGRRLLQTITSVDNPCTGEYFISVELTSPLYVIGKYIDVWTVQVEQIDTSPETITNEFEIYPNLWYTSPIPIVYDFDFAFRPNKIRKGSKKYLIIDIIPNVPNGSTLRNYYENIAIVSPLQISIEAKCGECLPEERDLRMVVENAPVELREKGVGYYWLDTCEMEEGVYDCWFTLLLGGSTYISDKLQLQIYN